MQLVLLEHIHKLELDKFVNMENLALLCERN